MYTLKLFCYSVLACSKTVPLQPGSLAPTFMCNLTMEFAKGSIQGRHHMLYWAVNWLHCLLLTSKVCSHVKINIKQQNILLECLSCHEK